MLRFATLGLIVLVSSVGPVFAAAPVAFDVNDLSILLPLRPESGRPYPEVALSELGASGKPLVPQSALDAGVQFLKKNHPDVSSSAGALKDWRIYAVRYDPCAPGLAARNGAFIKYGFVGCEAQIRLSVGLQSSRGGGPVDMAMHLIYGLGKGTPKADDATLAALLRWKGQIQESSGVSTTGRSLQVHPGLKSELTQARGNSGAIALRSFLKERLSVDRLVKVTFTFTDDDLGKSWFFYGFDVVKSTAGTVVYRPIEIPGLNGGKIQKSGLGSVSPPLSRTIPSMLNFFAAFPDLEGGEQGGQATPAQLAEAAIIDSPVKSHALNRDCVSCHVTGMMLNTFSAKTPGPSAYAAPAGVNGFVARSLLASAGLMAFRAFSYVNDDPVVSIRVANETAEVVDFVNREILRKPNPGPDCRAVREKVWACYLSSAWTWDAGSAESAGIPAAADKKCLELCVR